MGELFFCEGTMIFYHWCFLLLASLAGNVCAAQVGEGSFGRVLACVFESKKLAVAVKVVKGPAVDEHAPCRSMVGRCWVIFRG